MFSSGKPLYTLLCFCNHFGFSFRWWWKKVLGSPVCSVQPCASNIDSGCSRTNMWWTGIFFVLSYQPFTISWWDLPMVVFYTDSSAALDLIHKTRGANCVSQFSHLEHLDLLLPIWETRNNHSCALQRIKAPLEAASFGDSIEAYECLGNKLANDTAQQRNKLTLVLCLSMVSGLVRSTPQT